MRSQVVCVAAAVCLAACSSGAGHSGPQIRGIGNSEEAGIQLAAQPEGSSTTVQAHSVCTTGKAVSIDSVTPTDPTGGIRITSWGTRLAGPSSPPPDDLGASPGLVGQFPTLGHHPVTARCDSKTDQNQFYFSAAASSSRGTLQGVTLGYDGHTVKVGFRVAICTSTTCPVVELNNGP